MRYINLYDLSLNKINVFLTAAESSSFNIAARKLHYSQSMVSKSIAELEAATGLILFIRYSSKSVLTPAGHSLYKSCRNLMDELEKGIEQAQIVQTGLLSDISIGSCDTARNTFYLEHSITEFCRKHPALAVQYDEYTLSQLIDLAKEHKLDVIITAMHDIPSLEKAGYTCEKIENSCLAIYVPRSNPLFERDHLTVSDLAAEEFIVLSPVNNPNYITLLTQICRENGFTPKITSYISNPHAYTINLLKGNSIALADTITDISHKDIRMFALKEYPAGTVIAWDSQKEIPYIEDFLTVTKEYLLTPCNSIPE